MIVVPLGTGSITDLSTLLFDRGRSNLEVCRLILRDVHRGQCFYCRQTLKNAGEVDHFIPWSRYPTDLGHNFVLAHPGCNNAKSDFVG
jgi:5-methylcytosine-specific restriction endonuclease McrA